MKNKEFYDTLWAEFHDTLDEYNDLVRAIGATRGRREGLRRVLKAQGVVVADSPPLPSDAALRQSRGSSNRRNGR